MNRMRPYLALPCLGSILVLLAACAAPKYSAASNPLGVRIFQTNDLLHVELNGKLFTQYHYTNVLRPFCHPLMGPGEFPLTRDFPRREVAGETRDHPHHRSLWFGHEPVNGQDFWTERAGSGKIVHRGFADISSGVNTGLIKSLNDWVGGAGSIICSDERVLRFMAPSNGTILLDFEIKLIASHGDVTFGDSKEGTFAIRVADALRVVIPGARGQTNLPGTGTIVLSTGQRDTGASALAARAARREAVTWGKRAAWCDYHATVDGKTVGIAIMDHPTNPRHPTWWMVRDYGLFAANPFGQASFEPGADRRAGDFKIAAGQNVTFRYRIVLHEGDEKTARIAELYQDFAKIPSSPRP
jgi:hypothetical protein